MDTIDAMRDPYDGKMLYPVEKTKTEASPVFVKKVEVWLKETSEPLRYDAISTYQKGDFYCVYCTDEKVRKFPIVSIHKVVEGYGTHDQGKKDGQ